MIELWFSGGSTITLLGAGAKVFQTHEPGVRFGPANRYRTSRD